MDVEEGDEIDVTLDADEDEIEYFFFFFFDQPPFSFALPPPSKKVFIFIGNRIVEDDSEEEEGPSEGICKEAEQTVRKLERNGTAVNFRNYVTKDDLVRAPKPPPLSSPKIDKKRETEQLIERLKIDISYESTLLRLGETIKVNVTIDGSPDDLAALKKRHLQTVIRGPNKAAHKIKITLDSNKQQYQMAFHPTEAGEFISKVIFFNYYIILIIFCCSKKVSFTVC